MGTAADTDAFRNSLSGFAAMMIMALFAVVSTLLFAALKISDSIMARQLEIRAQEDLAGLRANINFVLRNQELCPTAFREVGKSEYYKVENLGEFFPARVDLDAIFLKMDPIVMKGLKYRTFSVDEISISNVAPGLGIRNEFLSLRANALQLKLVLSRKTLGGRGQKATLIFDLNNFFYTPWPPVISTGLFDPGPKGMMHCWATSAPGFNSCATRSGDSMGNANGESEAKCNEGETLVTGGGQCLNPANEFFMDGVTPPLGALGVLTKSRAKTTAINSWEVRCANPANHLTGRPSRAYAICCSNNDVQIVSE